MNEILQFIEYIGCLVCGQHCIKDRIVKGNFCSTECLNEYNHIVSVDELEKSEKL